EIGHPLGGGRGHSRVVGGVGVLREVGGRHGGGVGDRSRRRGIDVHDDREELGGVGGQRADAAAHSAGGAGAARARRDEADLDRQHVGHRAAAGGGGAVVGDGEGVGDVSAGRRRGRRALGDREIGHPLGGGRRHSRVVGGVGVLREVGGRHGGSVGDGPGRGRADVDDDREGLGGARGQRAEVAGHSAGGAGAPCARRDEADLGRQHISHRAAAGGGGAVVGEGEGVGDVSAGRRRGRRALGDREIGHPLGGGRRHRRVVGGAGVLRGVGGRHGGGVGDRSRRRGIDVHDDREGLGGVGGQRAEVAGHDAGGGGAARARRDEAHLGRQHISHRAAAGGGGAV